MPEFDSIVLDLDTDGMCDPDPVLDLRCTTCDMHIVEVRNSTQLSVLIEFARHHNRLYHTTA